MRDEEKTRKQLIEDLLELRHQNAVLRKSGDGGRPENLLRARLRLAHFALSHSMEELLQATLDEAELLTDSAIGFYHFIEEDQKTLSLQAWSTKTLLRMCSAKGKGRHYDVDEAGVWVDCVRERRPVVHNDYLTLKHRKGLPPGHAAVVRELVVPVFRGDRIVAIIGVGNKPREYDDHDVEAVSLLADLAWDIVESRKAEDKLRESNTRLQALINSIPDMVVFKDVGGKHLIVNKAVEEFTGLSHEEIEGKTEAQLLPPDLAGACKQSDEAVLKSRRPLRFEENCTDRAGLKVYFDTIKAPIIDSLDNVAGLVAISRDVTDRLKIEEALRSSELRLTEAQHIAHIGDWEWDIATNGVRWSDELYRIYGYGPHEISPDYGIIVGAMHPESREDFLKSIDAALKGESPFEMDYTFFRKDGSVAVLHTIGKVLYDSGGNAERMVGTVQDITDQKRAQKALGESEEKFRGIFDRANDGILIANVTTRRFTLANRTMCRMLGYPLEEIINLSIEDIHPVDELPRVLAEFDKQTRGEKTVAENLPVMRKDGSVFYADIGTTIIPLAGEQCAIGIFRDITERKKMEEALRNSRSFIESILDTVDQAFVVIDRDYRIVLANSAYGGQSSMPVEDLIGRHCYEISHQSTKPCYEAGEECAVRHSFEKGEPHTCVHKHYTRDGGILYVETKSYPLKDTAGEVVSAIEVINNITDKHLLEEQILRTQKLEAVGLLAGGIAHDFNNLLMGIFGGISMAKTFSDKNGNPYRMLEEAEKALDQARNLTKQLLTFSKGGEPVKSVLYLPSVIHSSVKFALSGSTVNYVFSMDDDLWLVEADEGQMKQVMHNLVINAGEAMPEGGTVRIEAGNVVVDGKGGLPVRPGKYVRMVIADTGTGISDAHISRIFDPYFTTKQRGSGLGLTTSYSIIKKHGGIIDVKSELGAGTTFFIYIPASEEKTLPEKAHEKRSFAGKGRILLMDDEEVVRTVAGYMLTILGYEVDFAEIGEKAVEKYSEAMKTDNPFKAVILDLTVRGGMGGRDTLMSLYKEDPEVRAVVSSGYSEDSILSNYKRYGFKAVLSKPYDIDELGGVLHAVIEG
jgi:PAS domain S-box-containing protein